jgi:hypothetical protein
MIGAEGGATAARSYHRFNRLRAKSRSGRADFAAIADNLDFIKAQLARIPTR